LGNIVRERREDSAGKDAEHGVPYEGYLIVHDEAD
jgi:hypothetical protein